MDCRCGGIISTTKVILDSSAAQKSFPNSNIPSGWDTIHILHGACTCGRYVVNSKPLEKEKPKTLSLF